MASGQIVWRSASPTGGARDDRDVQRQTDHQETEKDDNPVDDHSGALVEEDGDGEECRDQATDLRVHAQQ